MANGLLLLDVSQIKNPTKRVIRYKLLSNKSWKSVIKYGQVNQKLIPKDECQDFFITKQQFLPNENVYVSLCLLKCK